MSVVRHLYWISVTFFIPEFFTVRYKSRSPAIFHCHWILISVVRKTTLSFCAKPKGEVAESNTKEDIPFLMEEGDRLRRWVRDWQLCIAKSPHPPCRAPSPWGRRVNTAIKQLDSATPAQSPTSRMTATLSGALKNRTKFILHGVARLMKVLNFIGKYIHHQIRVSIFGNVSVVICLFFRDRAFSLNINYFS